MRDPVLGPSDLERLSSLREHARAAPLSRELRAEYLALREAFFAERCDAQNADLPGASRTTPRARRALQVELSGDMLAPTRVVTLDVGLGGFSALLPEALRAGTTLQVRLRVGSSSALEGEVAVVSARRRQRAAHVSFAFRRRQGDWSPFEDVVLDDLLSSLGAERPPLPGPAPTPIRGVG